MKSHLLRNYLLAPTAALVLLAGARAEDATSTIKFSDPSKPGTVKISLGRGELRVQGADTNEISVKSNAKPAESKPRKDGLRVISSSSSFSLTEKDNVVTLDGMGPEWGGKGGGDYRLTVPRNSTVIVQNALGGDVSCSNISGDIEINSMHGEIRLDDVSGGVVVGTMNGEIQANLRELHEGRPVSFTSMNGPVLIRVPDNAKANVRLRTQNGSVLTDFPDSALVTKTETAPGVSRSSFSFTTRSPKVLSLEIQEAIREATQISATAVQEALESVKEGLEAARLDSDEARRQFDEAKMQLDRARREADRTRRDTERQRRTVEVARRNSNVDVKGDVDQPAPPAPPAAPAPAAQTVGPAMPKPMAAPKPAKFPAMTISGGKLVTGTLNGGGPEISVSTMNGDVILRKLEGK
jgi:hypothetical protein